MPGYEWSSAILIRPIGRYRPQLWIPPVAWAQAVRRCLTKDACPHHLQAVLFGPFCPLYLTLVHIGPNFSRKGNERVGTESVPFLTDGIPTLSRHSRKPILTKNLLCGLGYGYRAYVDVLRSVRSWGTGGVSLDHPRPGQQIPGLCHKRQITRK